MEITNATIEKAATQARAEFLGVDMEDTFCKALRTARIYLELIGGDVPWWRRLLRWAIKKAIDILARGCEDDGSDGP